MRRCETHRHLLRQQTILGYDNKMLGDIIRINMIQNNVYIPSHRSVTLKTSQLVNRQSVTKTYYLGALRRSTQECSQIFGWGCIGVSMNFGRRLFLCSLSHLLQELIHLGDLNPETVNPPNKPTVAPIQTSSDG